MHSLVEIKLASDINHPSPPLGFATCWPRGGFRGLQLKTWEHCMQQFRTSDRARNMKLNTSTNVVAYSPCGFEMFYFFRFFFHHTVIIGYKLAPQQLSKAFFFFFCFVIPATSPTKQAPHCCVRASRGLLTLLFCGIRIPCELITGKAPSLGPSLSN